MIEENSQLKPAFGSRAWRKSIASNEAVLQIAASTLYQFLRFTHASQRDLDQGLDYRSLFQPHVPAIIAMWHGQHFSVPFAWPRDLPAVTLVSRSVDAEINARVLQRTGFDAIRGSGGRDQKQDPNKGGARALLMLRRSLLEGNSVGMIADISHSKARQAGEGIVTLARISGRPIIPVAYATSNRYVFEKSWDKTTLNLPFGRRSFVVGDPVFVGEEDDIATKQTEVTEALNNVTHQAYANVASDKSRRA